MGDHDSYDRRTLAGDDDRASDVSIHELHERVTRGDDAALNLLAARILLTLRRALRRGFPRVSDDLLADAVDDALMEYADRPNRFDTTRGVPLRRFLECAARRNLANLLKAEARRRLREAAYGDQVLRSEYCDNYHEECVVGTGEDSEFLRAMLSVISNDIEREAFLGWLRGVRKTYETAQALGLSHLSPADQKREVKRFRERIVKRLRRHCHKTLLRPRLGMTGSTPNG